MADNIIIIIEIKTISTKQKFSKTTLARLKNIVLYNPEGLKKNHIFPIVQ